MSNVTTATKIWSIEEILDTAKDDRPWDFDVEKKAMSVDGAETDRFAVQRADTKEIVGYCGKHYQPVSYGTILEPVLGWLGNQPNVGIINTMPTGGGRAAFEITFGDDIHVGPKKNGDIVRRSVVLHASHNTSRGVWGSAELHRLICTNGLTIPDAYQQVKLRHVGWSDERFAVAVDQLLDSVAGRFEDVLPVFNSWQQQKAAPSMADSIVREVEKNGKYYSQKFMHAATRRMLAATAEPQTVWSLYNIMTDRSLDRMGDPFLRRASNERTFEAVRVAAEVK